MYSGGREGGVCGVMLLSDEDLLELLLLCSSSNMMIKGR